MEAIGKFIGSLIAFLTVIIITIGLLIANIYAFYYIGYVAGEFTGNKLGISTELFSNITAWIGVANVVLLGGYLLFNAVQDEMDRRKAEELYELIEALSEDEDEDIEI